MPEMLCLSKIKTKYGSLTNTEKKIANYILKHYDSVIGLTISELSQRAGVVKSAVVRLCQSVGFSGYSQFKLALAAELAKNKAFNYIPYISPADSPGDVLDKVFSANIKTLHDTAAGIDRKALTEIVSLLYNANRIYIYGIGTSAGIVNDFQYRLIQLGYMAFCFTDVPSMKVSTLNITQGDVAIGISNSGRTIATVETLQLARERGAATACVTSYPDSPIVNTSDHALVIYTDEIQYPIEAISARIAHISVLDAISISLSAREYDKAVERSAQTHNTINTIRY